MVSDCRRYIFCCFDALLRNIISWIKIHQLILLKEMPENFNTTNTCQNIIILPGWSSGVECQTNYLKVSSSNPPEISMGLNELY